VIFDHTHTSRVLSERGPRHISRYDVALLATGPAVKADEATFRLRPPRMAGWRGVPGRLSGAGLPRV